MPMTELEYLSDSGCTCHIIHASMGANQFLLNRSLCQFREAKGRLVGPQLYDHVQTEAYQLQLQYGYGRSYSHSYWYGTSRRLLEARSGNCRLRPRVAWESWARSAPDAARLRQAALNLLPLPSPWLVLSPIPSAVMPYPPQVIPFFYARPSLSCDS
jgi:hypothetical protein